MKNIAQLPQRGEAISGLISPSLIFSILVLLAAFLLGMVLGVLSPTYSAVIAGPVILVVVLMLRLDEIIVVLVIVAHIFLDSYLGVGFHQVTLAMMLILLCVCYRGRSAERPWIGPRWLWLWILFFIVTIFPAINGSRYAFTDTLTYYLNLVLSAFLIFWLGNLIARNMASVRRVFQALAVLATLIAIHTLIQAITGTFLFETADFQASLAQYANFQLSAGIPRVGSFFLNPNGDAAFLAACCFLPLGLFVESKQLWAKLLYLLETLLILLALMFTYSNAGWAAALVGILVFVLLTGRVRYSALLLTLIVALAVIAFTLFPDQVAAQLSHASDPGEVSLHTADWRTAFRVIEAYPIFGVGLGTQAYLTISNFYRVPAQTVLLAEPDNSYLQWGAMAGVPALLVFLSLLGCALWFAWRNWLTVEARYRSLIGGGIAALISISITSLSSDVWTSTTDLSHIGWLIAGVIASPLIGRSLRRQSVPPGDGTAEVAEMNKAQQGS